MDEFRDALLTSGKQLYVIATGAGAGLQGRLWQVPGASAFLIGAAFPYATRVLDETVGFTPRSYCSDAVALDLAMEAFVRAGATERSVGVGVTASVTTLATRAHRGEHRVIGAFMTNDTCRVHHATLAKEGASRTRDGELADDIGENVVRDALGLAVKPIDGVETYTVTEADALARKRFFEHPFVNPDGTRTKAPESLDLVFPGSFDPPHRGHFGMADWFLSTDAHPVFWITASPPHKAPVPLAELLRRKTALAGRSVLFTEGDPLYIDKARRYPGAAILLGADAFERMFDPAWGIAPEVLAAEFLDLGTLFYVAERAYSGEVRALSSLEQHGVTAVPLSGFRDDISSSEIRARRTAG